MKFTKKFIACLTVLLLALATTTVAFAQESGVDWSRGVIRAVGLAAGKSSTQNPGLRRAQARRAAMMDAQRNLAEAARGVRVTSDSLMKDLELVYDNVRTQLDSTISGMSAISVTDNDDGTCEVVLEMPLFGAGNSLSSAAFLPFKNEPKAEFPKPVNAVTVEQSYTGLIIDCRGLNINCVMSPVIKNADGTKIYGHANLDIDKVIVNGMASYSSDAYDQISKQRAGNNPLVVKAVRLDDMNANPVVSVADADRILAANAKSKFLNTCAVVFLK